MSGKAKVADSAPHIPEIYVLWHPRCEIGQAMASRIYAWLRPGHGLGPDVHYRSLPAPDAGTSSLPLPIPGNVPPAAGGAAATPVYQRPVNLQIIIVLIDDNMVSDYAWRDWLPTLVSTNTSMLRTFFPVALDSTAYNIPPPLNERNFLRPVGVPITQREGPTRRKVLESAIRSLLKQLTEALCQLLLAPLPEEIGSVPGLSGSASKIAIFLSHAKADGMTPARRIRDFIYANTQLAAFYDENDIPFGAAFSRVLDGSIQSNSTAALIAVQSEKYATRPWCRRELSIFRRPRQEKSPRGAAEQWKLHPIVVVNALESGAQTTSIPEIGNATVIRWSSEEPPEEQPQRSLIPERVQQEEQIVTTVLRDTLLASFHSALGRCLRAGPEQIVINWLPDSTTLLHIPRVRDRHDEVEVLYPGRGLAGLELDILDELFPKVSFYSFDQASETTAKDGNKYRSGNNGTSLIGLSISFESQSLLARGFGLEHLRELLVRLARPILRTGADLAYGGNWKERDDNFTYDLVRLISAEREGNSLGGPDTSLRIGRLRNHVAWPHYLEVTPRIEAQWIQCCRIIRITQELAGIDRASVAPDTESADTERFLLHSAIASSQQRRLVAEGMQVPISGTNRTEPVPGLSALIILGGKTSGFKGFMPGIFEEALFSLKNGRPLYILGGFGGAAGVLARALLGQKPKELELNWLEQATPNLKTLRRLGNAQRLPAGVHGTVESLKQLRQHLKRAQPALAPRLKTGLSEAQTRELLMTHDMARAVHLVLKGLEKSTGLVFKRT
jgi:SLOG cluster2/TIR domain